MLLAAYSCSVRCSSRSTNQSMFPARWEWPARWLVQATPRSDAEPSLRCALVETCQFLRMGRTDELRCSGRAKRECIRMREPRWSQDRSESVRPIAALDLHPPDLRWGVQ